MPTDYLLVALFGLVAGAGELVTRYRDAPWLVVRRAAGAVYLAANALSGVFALFVVQALDIRFGPADPSTAADQLRWGRVLLAGFSGVALLRSALFTARVGDRDVAVGPAFALKALLDALDRAIDREQALRRGEVLDALRRASRPTRDHSDSSPPTASGSCRTCRRRSRRRSAGRSTC